MILCKRLFQITLLRFIDKNTEYQKVDSNEEQHYPGKENLLGIEAKKKFTNAAFRSKFQVVLACDNINPERAREEKVKRSVRFCSAKTWWEPTALAAECLLFEHTVCT